MFTNTTYVRRLLVVDRTSSFESPNHEKQRKRKTIPPENRFVFTSKKIKIKNTIKAAYTVNIKTSRLKNLHYLKFELYDSMIHQIPVTFLFHIFIIHLSLHNNEPQETALLFL